MGSAIGYPPHRQQLILSALLLGFIYFGVLASIRLLPQSAQSATTILMMSVMAVQLFMLPFLARDADHLLVRNALAANAAGVACAYATATNLRMTKEDREEARVLALALENAPVPAVWTAREILDGHPTVERSLPPVLQRVIEMVLLILGAIGGNLFAAGYAAADGTATSPELAFAFVVAAPTASLVAAAGIDRIQDWLERRKLDQVRERAKIDPAGLLQALPISDARFQEKFLCDLRALVHLVKAPGSGLVAYSYIASVTPETSRWRPTSHDAFSFTLWQFGVGLLLGGPATLAAALFQ